MASRHISLVAIVYLILFFVTASSASVRSRRHQPSVCPSECRCAIEKGFIPAGTMRCTSYNFLNKLSVKERSLITVLDLSNASLHTLDKRLKHFPNLERLNLSHNKISEVNHLHHLKKLTHLNLRSNVIVTFTAKHLPDSLEYLDVSHNFIKQLPQDLQLLRLLKRIDVSGNRFSCNRDSLDSRDMLLERKVKIIGPALCHDPAQFRGKLWLHVVDFDEYFKLHDQHNMLADQAEGSGESEGSGFQPIIESTTVVEKHDFFFEGSGNVDPPTIQEEGSGSSPLVPFINESDSSPEKQKEVEAYESDVFRVNKEKEVEDTTIDPKLGSLEKSSVQRNLGTTIFLFVFLLCLVSLLIYAIKKNRDKKREARRKARKAADKQSSCIELLPKQQHVINEKQNGNPESMPLMNGQNGNTSEPGPASEENDESADAIPHSQPTPIDQEIPTDTAATGIGSGPGHLPHLKTSSSPPSPDITSVKVKASEIPESVPRTPIVVTRSRSSDGKHIVVTPNLNKKP